MSEKAQYRTRQITELENYLCSMDCLLYTSNAEDPDLKKLPSAKGIWAPCLTYCEEDDLFYVVYGRCV